jgi:hypothetical protein
LLHQAGDRPLTLLLLSPPPKPMQLCLNINVKILQRCLYERM